MRAAFRRVSVVCLPRQSLAETRGLAAGSPNSRTFSNNDSVALETSRSSVAIGAHHLESMSSVACRPTGRSSSLRRPREQIFSRRVTFHHQQVSSRPSDERHSMTSHTAHRIRLVSRPRRSLLGFKTKVTTRAARAMLGRMDQCDRQVLRVCNLGTTTRVVLVTVSNGPHSIKRDHERPENVLCLCGLCSLL
jgi:hypothetical protein